MVSVLKLCLPVIGLVEPQFCVLVERRESCESLTVRSNGKSTDDSQRWVTLRNWDFVKSFSGMLCALTHPLTHSRSKIKMKHKGITEKQLRWRVNGKKRRGKDFSGASLEDFNTSSINWPSISNVCDQSVALLLKVCSHRRGFVRMCACHYRALQVETVCFDIPCCKQTESCFPLFPLRQCFHCGMLSSFAGPKNHSNSELFA